MSGLMSCSLCGHRFGVAAAGSLCASCPVNQGCTIVCCPQCGHGNVDVAQSRLAGLFLSARRRWFDARRKRSGRPDWSVTIADLAPGRAAIVTEFLPDIDAAAREHLTAYGMTRGAMLRVLRHKPVTVVQVDRSELAMEREIARSVAVRLVEPRATAASG